MIGARILCWFFGLHTYGSSHDIAGGQLREATCIQCGARITGQNIPSRKWT